jgi:hypothetical protein
MSNRTTIDKFGLGIAIAGTALLALMLTLLLMFALGY